MCENAVNPVFSKIWNDQYIAKQRNWNEEFESLDGIIKQDIVFYM